MRTMTMDECGTDGFDPRLPFRTRSGRRLLWLRPADLYPGFYVGKVERTGDERNTEHLFDGRGRHAKRFGIFLAVDGPEVERDVDPCMDLVNDPVEAFSVLLHAARSAPARIVVDLDPLVGVDEAARHLVDLARRTGLTVEAAVLGLAVRAAAGESKDDVLARFDEDCAATLAFSETEAWTRKAPKPPKPPKGFMGSLAATVRDWRPRRAS